MEVSTMSNLVTAVFKKIGTVFRHPDLSDQINKGHYHVTMSQMYTPVPEYCSDGYAPVFEYDTDTQAPMVRGTCTIAEMIDMFINGYTFIISRDVDTVDIYNLLSRYIETIGTLNTTDHYLRLQFDKICRFKKALEPEYICACRRLGISKDDTDDLFTLLLRGAFK